MRRSSKELTHIFGGSIIALVFSAVAAPAQISLPGQLNVEITIEAECELGVIQDINFGTEGVLTSNVDEEGSITVTCTPGQSYSLALDEGDGAGASESARLMTGPGAATVTYSLYTDAGYNDVWGTGADALSGTGTGSAIVHDVYGRVGPQATPAPGNYTDTVAVTLTY